MRTLLLAVGVLGCLGCGKKDDGAGGGGAARDHGAAAPATDGPLANISQMMGDYRTNPAAADAKYKGKTFRLELFPGLIREGGETVAAMNDARVRFASESEAASIGDPFYKSGGEDWYHTYRAVAKCEGLQGDPRRDGYILFTGARILETLPGHPRLPRPKSKP